jgi:RHS repeat-associated protein
LSNGQLTATYGPDDKRASKTQAGTTTYYIYDEASDAPNPILEEQGSGTDPTIVNAYGVAADGIRARYLASAQFYYVYQYDPMGNFLQRESAEAFAGGYSAIDTAQYDAYGNMLADIQTTNHDAALSRQESIGFGGQWGYFTDYNNITNSDIGADTGLLCLGHRYYDTGTGRFINRDPIGYAGGENLYAFCGGNPVNEVDPEGTSSATMALPLITIIPRIPGAAAVLGGAVVIFQGVAIVWGTESIGELSVYGLTGGHLEGPTMRIGQN